MKKKCPVSGTLPMIKPIDNNSHHLQQGFQIKIKLSCQNHLTCGQV